MPSKLHGIQQSVSRIFGRRAVGRLVGCLALGVVTGCQSAPVLSGLGTAPHASPDAIALPNHMRAAGPKAVVAATHQQVAYDAAVHQSKQNLMPRIAATRASRVADSRSTRSAAVRLRAPAGARVANSGDDSHATIILGGQESDDTIKLSPIEESPAHSRSLKSSVQPESSTALDGETVIDGDMVDGAGMQYGLRSNICEDWRDNVSLRFGATFNDVMRDDSPGLGVLADYSRQWHRTDLFMHAGLGAEYIEGEFPVAMTVGIDRLATIMDGQVVKPWVFSFAYDAYYDSEFYQTDDSVYLDQFRVLLGKAVCERMDVGLWAALGLQSDFGTYFPAPAAGPPSLRGRLGDRLAAYASINGKKDPRFHLVVSAGWEEDPGQLFAESDMFLPLNGRTNFVLGSGVSEGGTTDLFIGLEKVLGWRRARGMLDRMHDSYTMQSEFDERAGDPRTFRGGMSGGVHRGALRVIAPSRMRRGMYLSAF